MKKSPACFLVLIILLLAGCAHLDSMVGKYFKKHEHEAIGKPIDKQLVKEHEEGKITRKFFYTPAYEAEKKKIIEKHLERQLAKGDENFRKGNYGQAKKDYLTTYFIDPTNDIALKKLRRLPVVHSRKDVVPSPVQETPPDYTGEDIIYTVKPGDTLVIIAKKFYGDYKKYTLLAEVNRIQPPYIVKVGQTIIIPRGADGTINLEGAKKRGEDCFHTKDFDCTIKEFTAYLLLEPDAVEIKKYLKESYYEKISINFNSRNYAETSRLINDFRKIAAKYKIDLKDISSYITQTENSIKRLIEEEQKRLVADKLLDEGKKLQKQAMLAAAKDKYMQSLEILKEFEELDTEELKAEIVDLLKDMELTKLREEVVKHSHNEEYEPALEKIIRAAKLNPQDKEVLGWLRRMKHIVDLMSKAEAIVKKAPEQAFVYYKQVNSYILKELNRKSIRIEKEMTSIIPMLKTIAENKLKAEDPCGSLRILNIIIGVDEEISIPYSIKSELKQVYLRSSALKDTLEIKCNNL